MHDNTKWKHLATSQSHSSITLNAVNRESPVVLFKSNRLLRICVTVNRKRTGKKSFESQCTMLFHFWGWLSSVNQAAVTDAGKHSIQGARPVASRQLWQLTSELGEKGSSTCQGGKRFCWRNILTSVLPDLRNLQSSKYLIIIIQQTTLVRNKPSN